jgi:signal transduction histidine kinase
MTPQRQTALDRWERLETPVLNVVPFVLLAVSTLLALGIDSPSGSKQLLDLGLAALAAAWMLFMVVLHPAWTERRGAMGVFFIGFTAIAAVLVINDPAFGFFSWVGYIWAFRVLHGGARFAGVAATALVTATSQHGGLPTGSASSWVSWLAIVAVNLGVAGAVGWFSSIREEQHEARKQLIDELTEANARLEASLRENEGLHAQLLAQAREAGVLDERQRMAREIHDTLAQGLVGIITQLEAAAQSPHKSGESQRHTDAAAQLARESLSEARRSVLALRPDPLTQAQLPEALSTEASKWSSRTGVEASVTTTGSARPMRPEIEIALLRTAQEALANVAKHAHAGRVLLTLSYMEDLVTLDVRDDGVGLPASGAPAGHETSTINGGFGLTAMRQRVQGLAGALEIESEAGAGTTVSASIPAIPAGAGGPAP